MKNSLQNEKKIVLYSVIWCVFSKNANFHRDGGQKNGKHEYNSNAIIVTDKNEKLLIQNYRALHYAKQIQVLSSIITEAEAENGSK